MRTTPTITIAFAILLLPILLAVGLTGTASAQACNKTWTAPANGLWTNAANWTPAVVPGAADNVCIVVDGTYTVTLRGSKSVASVTVGAAGNNEVQTLLVQGGPSVNASLTAATGFTNSGDITLSSIASKTVTLTVTSGMLVNQGTINVEPGSGGARTISVQLDNGGTVNFRTAATLGRAGADHTNSGNFNINGATVTVTGNTLTNTPGGTISGTGRLNVSGVVFTNNGTVSPGLSSGILNLSGDYSQGASGSVGIEIGGLTAGTGFDRLNVTGNATLDGALSVGLTGGFVPISGDSFRVLSFGSGSGGFAAINDEDPSDGVSFESILDATGVTLKVSVVAVSPIARTDLNGDGRVGPIDLRLVMEKFNTSDGTADVDRDGSVGVLDLALVAADFGKTQL